MSRFHDEFFRQGSPAHDALMIKSVSSDGIRHIIDSINLAEKIIVDAKTRFVCNYSRDVIICHLKDKIHKVSWRAHANEGECVPKMDYKHGTLPDGKPDWNTKIYYCLMADICKHRADCGFYDTGILPYQKKIDISCKMVNPTELVGYETEVVISSGNGFILGYADALIKINNKVRIDGIVEDGWVWEGFDELDVGSRILIEAKPKITSIGEVIRQIKTYRRYLIRDSVGASVITTYSHLSKDALEYLRNEDIYVVVFEEDA